MMRLHNGAVVTFRLAIDSDQPASEAWRRVLDLRAHTRVIPLTTVTGDALSADALVAGSRFVGRTGLGHRGPFGFEDPMVVDEITPPSGPSAGVARIRKEGNVIRGSITLRVSPSPGGSTVDWQQDIRVRGVPGMLDGLVVAVARLSYAVAIRRLLAGG